MIDSFLSLSSEEQLALAKDSGNTVLADYLSSSKSSATNTDARAQALRGFSQQDPDLLNRIEQERQRKVEDYRRGEQEIASEVEKMMQLPPDRFREEVGHLQNHQPQWFQRWNQIKQAPSFRYDRNQAQQEQREFQDMMQNFESLCREQDSRQQTQRRDNFVKKQQPTFRRVQQPVVYQKFTKIIVINRPAPAPRPYPSVRPRPVPTATATPIGPG